MGIKEDVIIAATEILQQTPQGLTKEALVRQLTPRLSQRLPSTTLINMLRQQPQTFVEGGDGRWRLRQQANLFALQEEVAQEEHPARIQHFLRRGSYVVFDLEALGQDAHSPATEIIQIAAHRWVDGVPQQAWSTFVRPTVPIPANITELTKITMNDVRHAPIAPEALHTFFAYVGDLPLIAHNGASYDGPLIVATCERLGLPLPATFLVLDTLPLARALLPLEGEHKVGTLAKKFGCEQPNAHRADDDIKMLAGIVQGLEREMHDSLTGAAVYELLRRADDPWAALLTPPPHLPLATDILATFGAQLTPLLPERAPAQAAPLDTVAVDAAFARAETLGRTRREAQLELAHQVAETLDFFPNKEEVTKAKLALR